MMHVRSCADVRDELMEYCDGELPMDSQVLIHGHLQECVACRLEAHAIGELGDALRTMAGSVPGRASSDTGRITGAVLERIRLEQELAFTARVRGLFDDMHLVWAGMGASVAMLFCVFASAGVLHAASQERPDSLAGIISTIASADSTEPMRLADSPLENRALLDTTEAMQSTGEADLMLSAVVTPDGRIQNLAVLQEQAQALHVNSDVVGAMIEAASRARFERTQSGASPLLDLNVVWFVTTTTVKGLPDYDLYLVKPPRWTSLPMLGPSEPRKRVVASPKVPVAEGIDGLMAA